jgi:hypothetical protein
MKFFLPLFLAFLQSGDFRISTNVDLVLLDVSVKDPKGGYVSRLTKDNFKIEENGIPQKIASFSNADVPVEAGLVLDDSGSVRGKRADVNVAALTLVDASNPHGDNASKTKFPEIMRLIEESHATIYTVGIYDADDPDRNPGVLQRIAAISGGECFLLRQYKDIIPTGRKIAEDIRKRYTIGYIPDRGNGKPGLHRIRVTASAPDRGKLIVRTRTSYLDPGDQGK